MSEDIQSIKTRLRSINSIEHVTNAMKLVSASKMYKAKKQFDISREFNGMAIDAIEDLFHNRAEVPQKYLAGNRKIKRVCYVIVTGNRGFCGSFNNNVIKAAEKAMQKDVKDVCIVAIGTKGRDYFAKRNYEILFEYDRPPEDIQFIQTIDMIEPIVEAYIAKEIDQIVLVYNSYINSVQQEVVVKTILPWEIERDPEYETHDHYMEFEPNPDDVFNFMVYKYAETMIYSAVIESATAEYSARRVAMENATDNSREMIKNLSVEYNRARQASITNELIEIVSGAESLK